MTRNLRRPLIWAAVLALVVFPARRGQSQTAHNDLAAAVPVLYFIAHQRRINRTKL